MSSDNHGKRSTYTRLGCRCADCRAANTAYQWRRQHGEPEPYPTFVLNNFPLAIVARKAFPDDDVAIARCIADGSLS